MKQNSSTKKITPLKDGQHPVTALPKFTTDFPFFYLTKKKELLHRAIVFEDVDDAGRPVRWKVIPNNSPEIGAPGIEAHEVMNRLLQPAIDSQKTFDGNLPAIIPLGGVRECLRVIGWKEGGWTARDMLKAISQIGGAWVDVDFWLPTTKRDENGKALFRRLKGGFSRLSIWAIGSKHVTEDELEQGNISFEFDLDDTVYVQLHPMEVEMQRFQAKRFTDNEYWFSVDPSARRWYELIAPKIFGVVKHGGEYCEYLYSWYIKRHPTMQRYFERYRVVYQHTRLVSGHIERGLVKKLEFRAIKEPDKEIDYMIRCYVGPTAKESVSKVLGHLSKKTLRIVKSKPEILDSETLKAEPEQGSDPTIKIPAGEWTKDQLELIRLLNEKFSVKLDKASELVRERFEQTKLQIEAFPYHQKIPKNPAGWLIAAIEKDYDPPQAYTDAIAGEAVYKEREEERTKRQAEESERMRLEEEFNANYAQAIDAFIAEHEDEMPQRLEAMKKEWEQKHPKIFDNWTDDMVMRFIERHVHGDIAQELHLQTLDEYIEQHRSREVEPPPNTSDTPASETT